MSTLTLLHHATPSLGSTQHLTLLPPLHIKSEPERYGPEISIGQKGRDPSHPRTGSRRNARERNRIKEVNKGFESLRDRVPCMRKSKKLSKVETLRSAAEYIKELQVLLGRIDTQEQVSPTDPEASPLTCGYGTEYASYAVDQRSDASFQPYELYMAQSPSSSPLEYTTLSNLSPGSATLSPTSSYISEASNYDHSSPEGENLAQMDFSKWMS